MQPTVTVDGFAVYVDVTVTVLPGAKRQLGCLAWWKMCILLHSLPRASNATGPSAGNAVMRATKGRRKNRNFMLSVKISI